MPDEREGNEPIDPRNTDILQEEVRGDAQYDPAHDPDTKGPLERTRQKVSELLGRDDYPQQGEL